MSYAKGVHYERALLHFLETRGFSALRIAGSGHSAPADIIAMKKGLVVAVECKAHTKKPRLPQRRVLELKEWCERAGALGFLAWRPPQKEWRFLPMKNLEEKQYSDEYWLETELFLRTLI